METSLKKKMSKQAPPTFYHLHVYFDDQDAKFAKRIWEDAQHLKAIESVGRFHDSPIGPHPKRQFQLRVCTADMATVERWLEQMRGSLDVLVHPEMEDERLAHTALCRWLGDAHKLRLEVFGKS